MLMLTLFIALLGAHWIGDFVLQTHWQAAHKSRITKALVTHVVNYTLFLGVAAGPIFLIFTEQQPNLYQGWMYLGFIATNGLLHYVTDYFTSRTTSTGFGLAILAMQVDPEKAAKHWHNFFVVVGLDQLIHQLTLAVTFMIFFS